MLAQPELERLLQRHGEIQRAMRRPGGIRITVERELQAIREQLKNFPAALQAMQEPWAQPRETASPAAPLARNPAALDR